MELTSLPPRVQRLVEGTLTVGEYLGIDNAELYRIAKVGHELLRSGNANGARELFEGLVAAAPYDSVFHTHLAAAYATLDRVDDALRSYDAAVRFNVANVDAVAGRGEVLLRLNRIPEALADFRKAVELDPDCRKVSTHRARTLIGLLRRKEEPEAK